jgi:hypothetical protein
MNFEELGNLLRVIRDRRRWKPLPKKLSAERKTSTVKTTSKKKVLRQQDMFAYIGGLSEEKKKELFQKLINGA